MGDGCSHESGPAIAYEDDQDDAFTVCQGMIESARSGKCKEINNGKM